MSKFKVGDKVRYVGDLPVLISELRDKGIIGTVSALRSGNEVVAVFQQQIWHLPNSALEKVEGCLELVQEETINILTHRELLQALLDGETLVSDDNLEIQLESDGTTSMTIPTGSIREKYSMSFWHVPAIITSRNRTWTIKPKVILINGIEVPEPCRVKPEDGH